MSSPVVGVEAGGLDGGVVASLPVAPDPVQGHARVRLHRAEPTTEKGKVKSEAEKSEQLWGKNSVPNKHLFFHFTRPVSRCGGRGGRGRGGQMLELFCKRPGEHFTASCEIIVKTQWFMQR